MGRAAHSLRYRFEDFHLRHVPAEFLFHLRKDGQDRGRAPAADRSEPYAGDAVLDGNDFDAGSVETEGGGHLGTEGVVDAVGQRSIHGLIISDIPCGRL